MLGKKLSVLLFLCMVVVFLFVSQAVSADKTYTTSADFAEGTLLSVNSEPPNQLQLDLPTINPIVYVAASGRGTVVRIDADSGVILGEYLTAPEGTADDLPYPSRTAVDSKGNLWITNWLVWDDDGGSVAKIGLVIGGTRVTEPESGEDTQYLAPPFRYNTCIDRNRDGLIRTSRGLSDILPWQGNEAIDADDECVLLYQHLPDAPMAQHVSVDAADDVWVGGYPTAPSYFYKLDGETGEIIDGSGFSAAEIGCGGWGGLVDGNGILWSASQYENLLMYYNTDTGESGCISVDESYGLGVDTSGFIWNSMYSPNQVAKISPFDDDGNFNPLVVAGFPKLTVPANRSNAGLAVTPADNHVWIAKSGGAEVARLDNDGEPVKIIDLGESGEEPTGVAVDVRGRVWVTNFSSRTAMRINPTEGDDGSGAVDLTVELGENADPDNYSNMTGAVAPSGTWTVIYESDDNDTRWSKISWNSSEPDGTGIVVQARASNNAGDFDTEWTDPLIVTNGEEFDPDGPASPVGKFIQVRVTFNPNTIEEGVSPVLYDLTISSPQQVGVCDINEDAFIDLNDILPIFFTIGDSAGQNDPRDWDGDGTITIIDARGCVLDCNNPFCAPNQELR